MPGDPHARLTVLRSFGRSYVLKRLAPGGMLTALGVETTEAVLASLPAPGQLVLAPVAAGGRVVHEHSGGAFVLFARVRLVTDAPHLFGTWRANTSTFVRFHEALRGDLAPLDAHRARLWARPRNWRVDLNSPDWRWDETKNLLGAARAASCEALMAAHPGLAPGTGVKNSVPGSLDGVAHRDVVARNVALRTDGTPVLFDLDDIGLATTYTDVLTSGLWAGLNVEAMVFVIGRLQKAFGRPLARADLAVALRLMLRRIADEMGTAPGGSPDGHVRAQMDRVDRLLALAPHC